LIISDLFIEFNSSHFMQLNPIFILLAFLLSSCARIDQHSSKKTFHQQVDSILTESKFNGLVLIAKSDSTVYAKTWGYADLEEKKPLKWENQFVIGSISKQITAVLVLEAVEQNLLDLKNPISTYLPELNAPWKDSITVHQLLTHTHGITALDTALAFQPGEQFQYSQLGYQLLAEILENVRGRSFQNLAQNLFAKHGLNHSFHPNDTSYKAFVKGYEMLENGQFEYQTNSLQNYAAAGSFISTARDLNRWNQLLHSGQLLKKESFERMQTPYATRAHPVFGTVEYGYGLLFAKGEAKYQIGALGYAPGFASALYFYPQSGYSLVVLENTARDLDDFKKTFQAHTSLMDLIKTLHE
jgi:CubicO group peptidase (beta-lactamase class C family)